MTDALTTTIHAYRYDIDKPEDQAAYTELVERMKSQRTKCFETNGGSSHYLSWIDGQTVTLDKGNLFENQWNTGPIKGATDKGYRVFDWAQDYLPNNQRRNIKQGHYLDLTPAMIDIRRNTLQCGYCGHYKAGAHADPFCLDCIGSEYLKPADLRLLRLIPVADRGWFKYPELSEVERDRLMPIYLDAQTKEGMKRDEAARRLERARVEKKRTEIAEDAKIEYAGFTWLLDHGFRVDNWIFYTHTRRFCLGWMRPVSGELLSRWLDIASEFPYPYDVETLDEHGNKKRLSAER